MSKKKKDEVIFETIRKNIISLIEKRKIPKIDKKTGKTFYVLWTKERFYKDFSEKNGIERNTVESWIKKSIPEYGNLLKLAEYFSVSVDYLLGKAEQPENYTEQYIHDYTGLDYKAIAMLHEWKKQEDKEEKSLLYAQEMQSLRAINEVLCDKYEQEQKGRYIPDVFHFIGSYLIADKVIRERGYARFKSGKHYIKLNPGDIVTTAAKKETFVVDEPIITEEITNSNEKLGVYEKEYIENRYVLKISELYKANSLKRIDEALEAILNRKKENNPN